MPQIDFRNVHTSRSSFDSRRRIRLPRRLGLLLCRRNRRRNRLITAARSSDDVKHVRESRTPPCEALNQQRPLLLTEYTCDSARHAQRLCGLRELSSQQARADRYERWL